MRVREAIQSWYRRHQPELVNLRQHLNMMRIELGFGLAFWASLIFVVVQSGNGSGV